MRIKVGGGGVIGANAVAKAAPDGHTIGVATYGPTVYAPHLRSVPYNTKEDFTWIMQYSDTIMVFTVRADSRWKTFREFIEEARKNPGKVTFSSPGHLSGQHIFMEQVFAIEKVKVTHVPVSGGAEAVVQHLGGHVDGVLTSEVCPHVISGKLRGLAAQAEKRHERFPDIPTFFELGYKIDPVIWFGIYAPKGLDPIVFRKLYDAFKKAYEDPSFKEFLASLQTLTPIFRDSESFKTKVERDFDNQAKVLKEFGFVK